MNYSEYSPKSNPLMNDYSLQLFRIHNLINGNQHNFDSDLIKLSNQAEFSEFIQHLNSTPGGPMKEKFSGNEPTGSIEDVLETSENSSMVNKKVTIEDKMLEDLDEANVGDI